MNCIIMYLYHNYNDIVEKELIAMLFKPHCLSRTTLSKEELVKDRKNCRKFGPCGVGGSVCGCLGLELSQTRHLPGVMPVL